jgi:hypothetical protein
VVRSWNHTSFALGIEHGQDVVARVSSGLLGGELRRDLQAVAAALAGPASGTTEQLLSEVAATSFFVGWKQGRS